jgi:hypothetical protein
MHCPTCGKPATPDQQFCRTCGMNLESVGKLVARHAASPEEIQKRIDKRELDRVIASRMFNWLVWGMIVLGIGVVMIVVNKSFDIGKWFKLLSSLTMLSGIGIATAGLLNAMREGVQLSARSGRSAAPEIEEASTAKSLPTNPFPEALPSVTERTTQLIRNSDEM